MTDKIAINVPIAAPPATVFQALTDAGELEQWFAERAAVSCEKKTYDFWGRFTPGAPSEEGGRHRLLACEKDAKLSFEWPLRGDTTRVAIELEPSESGTLLKLEQQVPRRPKSDCSVGDFWLLSFENLRRHVEDNGGVVRCDYGAPARGTASIVVEIDAPRERVFAALTEPSQVDRWIAKGASIELEVGGKLDYGWEGEGPVKILELVPNAKLTHDWKHGNDPETIVTWTLEDSGGATRLQLVHSGFADERDTEDFRTGWLKHIIWMKATIEKGEAWSAPELVSADWDEV